MEPEDYQETWPVEWGDHFLMVEVRGDRTFAVFGKVADSIDAFCEREAACGLSPSEVDEQCRIFTRLYDDGWRPSDLYADMCPDGTYLTVHVSNITQKISAEAFESAQRCGWNFDYLLREGLAEIVTNEGNTGGAG